MVQIHTRLSIQLYSNTPKRGKTSQPQECKRAALVLTTEYKKRISSCKRSSIKQNRRFCRHTKSPRPTTKVFTLKA